MAPSLGATRRRKMTSVSEPFYAGLLGRDMAVDLGTANTLVYVRGRGVVLDEATAKTHYAEHDGKPFFGDLVAFITRSPLVALVVEGPDAYKVVRTLMGTTNPREAAPGTIRGDLAIELTENLVHGSDGPESAAREIALFFPGLSG